MKRVKGDITGQFAPGINQDDYCEAIENLMRKCGIECLFVTYGVATSKGVQMNFSAHNMNKNAQEIMKTYVDAGLEQIAKQGADHVQARP